MKKTCCDADSCTHNTDNPQHDRWHTIPAADELWAPTDYRGAVS